MSRMLRRGLIFLLTTLFGCGILGVLTWQALPTVQRAAAQQRWAERPFRSYRLAVRERTAESECEQHVQVRDERVVRVLKNSCDFNATLTVTFLFRRIEAVQSVRARCITLARGYSCVCQSFVETLVEYDPTTGYPREFSTWLSWRANWTKADYWQAFLANLERPDCDAPPDDLGRSLRVISFTPLP